MAAVIGMADEQVEAMCAAYDGGEVLEPVNYNAPGQVVVAGQSGALDWLVANGKAHGARMVKKLPVSVPSHCSLMRKAAEQLAEKLAGVSISAPSVPVYHNLDAKPRSDADGIREALKEQLYKPVRWTQTITALSGQGIAMFCECGPGKVLVGLNKRIVDSAQSAALEDPAAMELALATIAGQ